MILMTSEINHIIDRMFFRYGALLKKTISELYMNCYDRTSQFCCYRKRKSLFAIMHDYFGRICYQGKESFFLCYFLLVFVFWLLGGFWNNFWSLQVYICGVLRDLVLFVQFSKREKRSWRSVTLDIYAVWILRCLNF